MNARTILHVGDRVRWATGAGWRDGRVADPGAGRWVLVDVDGHRCWMPRAELERVARRPTRSAA